jgi:hypothetical protein
LELGFKKSAVKDEPIINKNPYQELIHLRPLDYKSWGSTFGRIDRADGDGVN